MSDNTVNAELEALLAKQQETINAAIEKRLNEALAERDRMSIASNLPADVREDAIKLLRAGATAAQVNALYAAAPPPAPPAQQQQQQQTTTVTTDTARPSTTPPPNGQRDFAAELTELNKLPFAAMHKKLAEDAELRSFAMRKR